MAESWFTSHFYPVDIMIYELAQTLSNYIRRHMGDFSPGAAQQITIFGQAGLTLEAARKVLHSLIWITYRKGFPPLFGYESDAGWGCMIRSGQMLLANVLLRLQIEEKEALKWFIDSPEHPLSVHKLTDSSPSHPGAGQWYGPLEISRMMATCLNRIQFEHFRLIVCDDGLYKNEIVSLCSEDGASWKRGLLVIPLRLGLGRFINPIYSSALLEALQIPQSCGFIGGRPRSSLYIVGTCGDQLLYFDPHVNQQYVGEDELDRDTSSFHCNYVRAIPVSDLDPCLALAFLIDSRESLDSFWRDASAIQPPMFDMQDCRPRYNPPETTTETEDDFVLL